MTYTDGLIFADSKGYFIGETEGPLRSFSVVSGDICAIALNHNSLEGGEEKIALFHELGHCETGSFYNQRAALDIRQKHENRADKWAIKKLVPKDELDAAVTAGHTELWDLAEFFDVTEDFMRKALHWYKSGNMAPD